MEITLGSVDLREICHQKGFRHTKQRQVVADFLWKHKDKHFTTDEAYEYIKKVSPDIGKVTVHRTFHLLKDLGFAKRADFGDGLYRYEICSLNSLVHTHHHMYCTECKDVVDIHEDMLEGIEKLIEQKYGFKILDHKLQFDGICEKCKINYTK